MSLNFPDRPGYAHLLDLESRGKLLMLLDSSRETLENSHFRVIVTYGTDSSAGAILKQNKRYLATKKFGKGKIIYKPTGGMLDVWKESEQFEGKNPGTRVGNSPCFRWPLVSGTSNSSPSHGAPGKLILVAETLLHRIEVLKANASNTADLIHGAVLAGDAAELLAGRTPILTLSALALKHEFETRAECEFRGRISFRCERENSGD